MYIVVVCMSNNELETLPHRLRNMVSLLSAGPDKAQELELRQCSLEQSPVIVSTRESTRISIHLHCLCMVFLVAATSNGIEC